MEISIALIFVLTVKNSDAKRKELAVISETQPDANHLLLCFSVNLRCRGVEEARNDDAGPYQALNTVRDGGHRRESLDPPPQGCCCDKDQKK